MSQQTISKAELDKWVRSGKMFPGSAHLPGFGLIVNGWNFHDPELTARAEAILQQEGIKFAKIDQTAPALFWYQTEDDEVHLHHWSDQQAIPDED